MGGRIRVRKNNRACVDSSHCLNYFLVERLAHSAHSDDRGRFERIDGFDKVLDRRVFMRIGLLQISQILAAQFQQSVYVKKPGSGPGLIRLNSSQRH
jgi:hypothetical protein